MKFFCFLLLIAVTNAQDGFNTSNTTTGIVTTTSPSTTTLRGVTTTLDSTSVWPTTTSAGTTTQEAAGTTTTPGPVDTTTVVPPCSPATKNSSCKVCLGPLCKFVERGEQGVGWEIVFVAFFMAICGAICLGLYYVCLKPVLYHNTATDILWLSSDDDDDEDFFETAKMLGTEEIRRKSSPPRSFEIVDLNLNRRE